MSVFRATSELHAIPNSCKKYIILQFFPLNHYTQLTTTKDLVQKLLDLKTKAKFFVCLTM